MVNNYEIDLKDFLQNLLRILKVVRPVCPPCYYHYVAVAHGTLLLHIHLQWKVCSGHEKDSWKKWGEEKTGKGQNTTTMKTCGPSLSQSSTLKYLRELSFLFAEMARGGNLVSPRYILKVSSSWDCSALSLTSLFYNDRWLLLFTFVLKQPPLPVFINEPAFSREIS